MKIPKSINILGNKWKIKTHDKDIVYENMTVEGLCIPIDRIIHVRLRNKTSTMETLFHELGHALMHELGLRQSSLTHDLEEIIVEGFSRFLVKHFNFNFK